LVFGPNTVKNNTVNAITVSTSEIRKTKKLLDERNGESDRRGDSSSSFVDKKARISVQMQILLNSFRT
jgi:hypothetical protein